MSNLNQNLVKKRMKKFKKVKLKALNKCPQKQGICFKVTTTSPKKPNSAIRKIAKVKIIKNVLKKEMRKMKKRKDVVIAGIPGIGHTLLNYSCVLLRGGKVNDVVGVKYKLIRGKYDFLSNSENIFRANRRSKYGVPKPLKSDHIKEKLLR